MSERKNRLILLTLWGDGSLLLFALMGFTGSFLTLYGDRELGEYAYGASPLDQCAAQGGGFLLLAALFALISLAVWSLPRFRGAAAAGLAALTGLAVFLNWERVVQGAGLTLRTVTAIFSHRVSWGWAFSYDPDLTRAEATAAVQLFLVLALTLLAPALGWAVVRARRWWVAAALTLPPLLPGLLADLFPNWPAFLALCACWCAMLLCDLCKWAAPSGRAKLTLAALACVWAVLAAISLAFPKEGYSRPQWALDRFRDLQNTAGRVADYFSQWDGPFHPPAASATYVGSAGEADLARAGPLNYTRRTVLRLTTDYSGRMYLRGSSLAVYEDGVWAGLPEGAYQDYLDSLNADEGGAPSPLLLPGSWDQTAPCSVTVENVGASGSCVYTPYFLTEQDWAAAGMLPVEDAYFARLRGRNTHTMAFSPPEMLGLSYHAGSLTEEPYLSLVREHYLDVPEELREPLLELYIRGNARNLGFSSTGPLQKAMMVAQLLNELCEYDPKAPAAPNGVDPVEYFLFDSHRGYCMHYTSAATLMLRALDIPARYVSGFTADCQPDMSTDVPDRAAHAWVEIYMEGFGWYPVEVTPAAAFQWYEEGELQPTPSPSLDPEESGAPESTPTPEPAASQAPSAVPSAEIGGPAGGAGLKPPLHALKALAILMGAAALLWLGQWLPKRLRAKRLSSLDRNRAALDGYGYLRRLERWGGRVDERAAELAQKARFSQHTLTREEMIELRGLVDRERARLCAGLGPVKRLAFRYLWGAPRGAQWGKNAENPPENGG